MKTQHTPGPWEVWNCGESVIDVAVCQIVTTEASGIPTKKSEETGEANARLIAAAPELLEALQSIASEAQQQARIHGINGATAALARLAEQARAAIAKATNS